MSAEIWTKIGAGWFFRKADSSQWLAASETEVQSWTSHDGLSKPANLPPVVDVLLGVRGSDVKLHKMVQNSATAVWDGAAREWPVPYGVRYWRPHVPATVADADADADADGWIPHDGGLMPTGLPKWIDVRFGNVRFGGDLCEVERTRKRPHEVFWRWTPSGFGVHAWRPHVPSTVAEPTPVPDIAPDYRETLSGAAALLQATAEVSDVRAVLATVEVVRGMLDGVVGGEQ